MATPLRLAQSLEWQFADQLAADEAAQGPARIELHVVVATGLDDQTRPARPGAAVVGAAVVRDHDRRDAEAGGQGQASAEARMTRRSLKSGIYLKR